jgi:hypothetical protein
MYKKEWDRHKRRHLERAAVKGNFIIFLFYSEWDYLTTDWIVKDTITFIINVVDSHKNMLQEWFTSVFHEWNEYDMWTMWNVMFLVYLRISYSEFPIIYDKAGKSVIRTFCLIFVFGFKSKILPVSSFGMWVSSHFKPDVWNSGKTEGTVPTSVSQEIVGSRHVTVEYITGLKIV